MTNPAYSRDYSMVRDSREALKIETEFAKITNDEGFVILKTILDSLLKDTHVYEQIELACKCYENLSLQSQYMELRGKIREILKKHYKCFETVSDEVTTGRFIVTIIIEKIAKREFDHKFKHNLNFVYQGWAFNDIKHYERYLANKNTPTQQPQQPGESVMPNPTKPLETITYFYGQDINLIDDELAISHLDRLANEIEKAKQNKSGSKKLAAKIKAMEDDLEKMRDIIDNRPDV